MYDRRSYGQTAEKDKKRHISGVYKASGTENIFRTYSAGDKVLLYTTINIRESMSTTAKKVAVAYAGQKVEVVMQYEDGWTKVKYDGKEGYVKSEYLGPQ